MQLRTERVDPEPMDPLRPLIDTLHADGRLRVWSLVITIFGDMVQHRGGVVSTARLTALLSRIGVERGTLRTALSRLARDGWVENDRIGRTSLYRLSVQGRARFEPATHLIYAPPSAEEVARWSLAVTMTDAGEQVALVPAGQVLEGADLVLTGALESLSERYKDHLLGVGLRAALDRLAQDLTHLGATRLTEPLDAAAARMLLIHRWRRLVLRHPEPHDALLPKDIALRKPRAAVARRYHQLSPLTWLETGGDDASVMPAATADFERRFLRGA